MRNLTVSTLLIFLCLACYDSSPSYEINKIEWLIQSLVEKKRNAGIAYGLQIGDSISVQNEFGLADLEKNTPLNKDHQFRIASITKTITATAIMQLIEKEQIGLDTPINQFFPNFPNAQNITIYHLLSHTSGIPNWWEGQMPKNEPSNFPMCEHPHLYLEKMQSTSLFKPGMYYSYSNSGYVLLGEIIEIISGQPYIAYLEQYIFQPAGMSHTEMEYINQPSVKWAKGYRWSPDSENNFLNPEVYHMPFSAGGLRSTAEDLLNFMKSLFSGELISEVSLHKMINYAKTNEGQPVYEKLFTPDGQAPRFPKNIKKWGYGLGFQIMENFGTTVISHGGDIAGFNSILMYIPKSDTRLIILSNTENGILSKLKKIEKLSTQI